MSMGMDWNGSGAGGTMQWVPDPAPAIPSKSTDADTSKIDNEKSDGESNLENKPDETKEVPQISKTDETDVAVPTIDEYGLEITEPKDAGDASFKPPEDSASAIISDDSSKEKPLSSTGEPVSADTVDEYGSVIGGGDADNAKESADTAPVESPALTATLPAKPFDYQAAADDLIASPPSPSLVEPKKAESSKTFDDSRFAMDKEDEEVVETLSFKLYDGRSKL
mmetsp:Transcript_28656/g.83006  ORF Transcript_28656/g.83006 Transcript_28656/m.83006 type:complete len:224 (-) Transcript_28656:31-702(-)